MANPKATVETAHYDGPAGGWGSLKGISRIFGEEWPTPAAIEPLARQNRPHGFRRALLMGKARRLSPV